MTKPWEETWTAERETLHGPNDEVTPADWWIVRKGSVRFVGSEYREDEAKLTAAAPDMVRVLLTLEELFGNELLVNRGDDAVRRFLGVAQALDAALHKAGVR